MTKYILEVCTGDCEFNQEFELEFDSLHLAEAASLTIEESSNVLYTEITEMEK